MAINWSRISLFEATPEQVGESRKRNYLSWGRGLDLEGYLEGKQIVDAGEYATGGKLRIWVLAPIDDHQTLNFFCACETFQRQALLYTPTSNGCQRAIAYGIASVFCHKEHRNKGYTSYMMRLLHYILAPANSLGTFPKEWGSPPLQPTGLGNASFSALWSVVGSSFYENLGPNTSRLGWRAKGHFNTVWQYREMEEDLSRVQWLSEDDCAQLWEEDALYMEEQFRRTIKENPQQTSCLFLSNYGLAMFQVKRAKLFLSGSLHLRMPMKWGVKLVDDVGSPEAYATWITDVNYIGYTDMPLIITRMRADEKTFPIILAAAMEAAKENDCRAVGIWNLESGLREIGKRLGGEEVQDLDCVTSVAWYGSENVSDVKILFNERYCYC